MQVLALLRTQRASQALRHGTEQWACLTVADSPADIEAVLHRARMDALILELHSAHGSLEPLIWNIRRRYPSLLILLYYQLSSRTAHEVLRLAKAGADELIVAGEDDDGRSLRHILVEAGSARCAAQSLAVLAKRLPPRVHDIVANSLRMASTPLTVRQLAASLGVNRKTLVNRLAAAGLPGPATLISWCRILLACELLQDSGRSVEQVALLLGFGSGVALRNMCRRHLGFSPTTLRDLGAVNAALDRLFATAVRPAMAHPVAVLAHSVTAD